MSLGKSVRVLRFAWWASRLDPAQLFVACDTFPEIFGGRARLCLRTLFARFGVTHLYKILCAGS